MKKTLGLTDAKKRQPANVTCLRRLARIWDERRTGLIRGVNGVIRIADGELVDPADLKPLRKTLRQPKLLWRDQESSAVGKPLLGHLLMKEASLLPPVDIRRGQRLSFTDTSRLTLSDPTTDWLFDGGVVTDLIRMPKDKRKIVRREVSALMILGLCSAEATGAEEPARRRWLETEFSRIRQADTAREIVGCTPIDTPEQVLFVAKKKVKRCLELRDGSSNRRVQQMATQVAGAVMSAAKSLA